MPHAHGLLALVQVGASRTGALAMFVLVQIDPHVMAVAHMKTVLLQMIHGAMAQETAQAGAVIMEDGASITALHPRTAGSMTGIQQHAMPLQGVHGKIQSGHPAVLTGTHI